MATFIEGKNGYLFLENDTNGVLSQTTGELQIGSSKIDRLLFSHQSRYNWCEFNQSKYIHLIVPNKETVLVEHLPDDFIYERNGPTPVRKYLSRRLTASQFTFFDPYILKSQHVHSENYYKRDTHWNCTGAIRYLSAALDYFSLDDEKKSFQSLSLIKKYRDYEGDLSKYAKLGTEPDIEITIESPNSNIIFEGNVTNEGYMRHVAKNTAYADGVYTIVLHDSFVHWLFPILSELYENIIFIHCADFDPSFIKIIRPKIVWFIQAERFFPRELSNEINIVSWLSDKEVTKSVEPSASIYLSNIISSLGRTIEF